MTIASNTLETDFRKIVAEISAMTDDRRKKVSVMRDADNLENRVVQNTIERYLLTSDSSHLCSTVHIGKMGDADKTTIAIFPKKLGISDIKEVLQ